MNSNSTSLFRFLYIDNIQNIIFFIAFNSHSLLRSLCRSFFLFLLLSPSFHSSFFVPHSILSFIGSNENWTREPILMRARKRCCSFFCFLCSLYEITSNVHITHGNDHQRKPVFLIFLGVQVHLLFFLFWNSLADTIMLFKPLNVLSSLHFARLANTHLEF